MATADHDWIRTDVERLASESVDHDTFYNHALNKFHAFRVSKFQQYCHLPGHVSNQPFMGSFRILPLIPQPTLLMQSNPLPPHRNFPLTHPNTTPNPPFNHLITFRTLNPPCIHIRPDHLQRILEVVLSGSNGEPIFYGGAETWDAGGDFDVVDWWSQSAVGVDLEFEGSGDDAVCYL